LWRYFTSSLSLLIPIYILFIFWVDSRARQSSLPPSDSFLFNFKVLIGGCFHSNSGKFLQEVPRSCWIRELFT
jgi:hypothetical protein